MSKRTERLHALAWRLFLGSLGLGLLALLTLCAGIGLGGAGHGDWTVWYFGLFFWFASWCVLLASVIAGFESWRRSGQFSLWLVPAIVLLISTGLLGLWGLRG